MRLKVPVWKLVSRVFACTNSNNELESFAKETSCKSGLIKFPTESATKACHPYARTRPRDKTSFPEKDLISTVVYQFYLWRVFSLISTSYTRATSRLTLAHCHRETLCRRTLNKFPFIFPVTRTR